MGFAFYQPDITVRGLPGLNFDSMYLAGANQVNGQIMVTFTLALFFAHIERNDNWSYEKTSPNIALYTLPLEDFIRFSISVARYHPQEVWKQYYQLHLKYKTDLACHFNSQR